MRVLVSGSTGLIGSALVSSLRAHGHEVVRLVRSPRRVDEPAIRWDPEGGTLDLAALGGFDTVVHLAGESISASRWTASQKARIRESRVLGTGLLCRSLARIARRPRVIMCASAVGYYGDRGEEILTEASGSGSGFLAGVCREWEGAAIPAVDAGIRVVHARFGIVLSPNGGALAQMLPVFRLGSGGPLGSGLQFVSWVAIDDALGAIEHAIVTPAVRGPMNVAAPGPVTNREFVAILAQVLARPARLAVSAVALRLMLGEMADEMLLASARLEPGRLLATGYAFRYPVLEGALRHLLSQGPTNGR